jgi:hypothetical protein
VCLGSFVPWDVKRQSEIIERELGWQGDLVENVPPQYRYEKIECYMQGVRDYIKFIKRGYSRPSHLVAIDIRNGRLDKQRGQMRVEEFEGRRPPSLDLFLEFIGLSEEEFLRIAMSHQVSPYEHRPDLTIEGRPVPDFDRWSREGAMPRPESEAVVRRWAEQNPGSSPVAS